MDTTWLARYASPQGQTRHACKGVLSYRSVFFHAETDNTSAVLLQNCWDVFQLYCVLATSFDDRCIKCLRHRTCRSTGASSMASWAGVRRPSHVQSMCMSLQQCKPARQHQCVPGTAFQRYFVCRICQGNMMPATLHTILVGCKCLWLQVPCSPTLLSHRFNPIADHVTVHRLHL